MKPQRLALLLLTACALLGACLLAGCVTDAAGNTRFDADTFSKVTTGTLDAYERARRIENAPVVAGYAPDGTPIYRRP